MTGLKLLPGYLENQWIIVLIVQAKRPNISIIFGLEITVIVRIKPENDQFTITKTVYCTKQTNQDIKSEIAGSTSSVVFIEQIKKTDTNQENSQITQQ